MSSPSDIDESPNWAELAPNLREQQSAVVAVARQVRIMFAAGKTVPEVCVWLQEVGLSNQEAEAFLAALTEAEQKAAPGGSTVTSGPWDFGGVLAPRADSFDKRRERKARQAKSRLLANAEPDPALNFGGGSYAKVVGKEAHRRERGTRLFTWITVAAVTFPILVIIAMVVLGALGIR